MKTITIATNGYSMNYIDNLSNNRSETMRQIIEKFVDAEEHNFKLMKEAYGERDIRIQTVNMDENMIERINNLVGHTKPFISRSELFRFAVFSFIREYKEENEEELIEEEVDEVIETYSYVDGVKQTNNIDLQEII